MATIATCIIATCIIVAIATTVSKIVKISTPLFSNSCKDHNKLSFKALSQMVLKL